MIFSALFVASVAYAQNWNAGLSYFSPNSTCQGTPDLVALFLATSRFACSDSTCRPQEAGLAQNYRGYDICNATSASKLVEDAFGSTPYVVFETYEDEQCTKLDRTYVYKANNVCLLGARSLSFSLDGNGVSFRRDCKSSPPSSPVTIPSNLLSKTTCRLSKDVGGDISLLHNGDFTAGVRVYTSAQGPPSNPPNNPTISSTSGTNTPATSTSVTNPTGKPTTTSNPSYSSAWGIAASLPIVLVVSVVHLFQ